MYLHKHNIEKILSVLEKFPNVNSFELNETKHSGVGSILTITFDQVVNEVNAQITVEISGVENW
jgi:hypothetical protein